MSDDKGSYEITAKVHAIPPTKVRKSKTTGKEYTDRSIVLVVDPGMYEQLVAFEVRDKQAADLAACRVGDIVTVAFNLRGREWKDDHGEVKYFNSCSVWKLEIAHGSERGPSATRPANADDMIPF